MKTKYIATFAAILMVAGCASALVWADDADADPVEKTIYVINGETAELTINQTLNALSSYNNTISWMSGETDLANTVTGTYSKISMTYTKNISAGTEVPSTYTLKVEGTSVGSETYTVKMSVTSKVGGEVTGLTQQIEYKIKVNVLPASFTYSDTTTSYANKAAVGSPYTTTTSIEGLEFLTYLDADDYIFYATGLPNGVAMDSQGRISGTPNVSGEYTNGGAKTWTFTVKVIATHKASGLAISDEFDFVVKDASAATFKVTATGDSVVAATDGAYKCVGTNSSGNNVTIGITAFTTGFTYEVYAVDSTDTQKSLGKIQVDGGTVTFSPTGTGQFIIIVVCSDGSYAEAGLYVVEPVEDITTGIGFVPGKGTAIVG